MRRETFKPLWWLLFIVFLLLTILKPAVSSQNANDVVKLSDSCHYSCGVCTGPSYNECLRCSTIGAKILQKQIINGITVNGLSSRTVSLVIGECACQNASTPVYSEQNCTSDGSTMDKYILRAGKAASLTTLFFGLVSLLMDQRTFYLLESLDIVQYFGNFGLLETKGVGTTLALQKQFFDLSNPTFLLAQENSSSSNRSKQVAVLNSFRTPIVQSNYLRIFDLLDVVVHNPLQATRHFQASQLLKNHTETLFISELSCMFVIIIAGICFLSAVFNVAHRLCLKERFSSSISLESTSTAPPSDSQSMISDGSTDSKINQFKRESHLLQLYKQSPYYHLTAVLSTSSLIFFYIALNEQLLYVQVAHTLNTFSSSKTCGLITTLVFTILFTASLITFKLSRMPHSHYTKQSTVIFDGLAQQVSLTKRSYPLFKVLFKIAEAIVFFQLAESLVLQCILLAVLAGSQTVIYFFLKPFIEARSNFIIVASQATKIIVPLMYIIQNSQSSSVAASFSTIIGFLETFSVIAICLAPITELLSRSVDRLSHWLITRDYKKAAEEKAVESSSQSLSISKDATTIVDLTIGKMLLLSHFPGSPTEGQLLKANQSVYQSNNMSALFARGGDTSTLFCDAVAADFSYQNDMSVEFCNQEEKQKVYNPDKPSSSSSQHVTLSMSSKEITIIPDNGCTQQQQQQLTTVCSEATVVTGAAVITQVPMQTQEGNLEMLGSGTPSAFLSSPMKRRRLMFRSTSNNTRTPSSVHSAMLLQHPSTATPVNNRIIFNQPGGGFNFDQINEILDEQNETAIRSKRSSTIRL